LNSKTVIDTFQGHDYASKDFKNYRSTAYY
jgi:hypothetical protein